MITRIHCPICGRIAEYSDREREEEFRTDKINVITCEGCGNSIGVYISAMSMGHRPKEDIVEYREEG